MQNFTKEPCRIYQVNGTPVFEFDISHFNSEEKVINNFGDEWNRFDSISENDIIKFGETYFDILDENMLNSNTYAVDLGCGTGRFSKYLSQKVRFI